MAKAKALRVYIEPLITKSKQDTTHSRITVFSYLKQKEAITELFSDIATKIADRPGGYTRILKLSNRLGDNAQMAYIELVDYNQDYTTDKPTHKKARRTKKKTVEAAAPLVEEAVVVEEEVKAEETVVEEEVKAEETVVEEEVKAEEIVVEEDVKAEENPVVEEVDEEAPATEENTEEDDTPENKEQKGE